MQSSRRPRLITAPRGQNPGYLNNIKIDFNFIYIIIKERINFFKAQMAQQSWLADLSEEDVAFIKRFVLSSGSLKELAQVYGVTYPTIRLRLDRLIEKIKVLDESSKRSPFERTLRALYADGKIEMSVLRTILDAHDKEIKKG